MFLFGASYSQAGARKKEGKTVHRSLKRLLKQPKTSPWIYRKTNPGRIQDREMSGLFRRWRTNGEKESSRIKERQNRFRAKRRVRGNRVFHKRKYF